MGPKEGLGAVGAETAPFNGRATSVRGTNEEKISICGSGHNRRILNYDYYGRNLKDSQFERSIGVCGLSVLSELSVGGTGVLIALDLPESVQNHLMHMGFVPDALVTALRRAPAGDPTVYGVDGMEIALRRETAAAILVREADAVDQDLSEALEDAE
jgi:Fe2+ transport system protein FeoA